MVLVASAACAAASTPDESARIPADNIAVVREELPSPPVRSAFSSTSPHTLRSSRAASTNWFSVPGRPHPS